MLSDKPVGIRVLRASNAEALQKRKGLPSNDDCVSVRVCVQRATLAFQIEPALALAGFSNRDGCV